MATASPSAWWRGRRSILSGRPTVSSLSTAVRSRGGRYRCSECARIGTPVNVPLVRVRPGGYRFLPNRSALVYLARPESLDFSLLDLVTGSSRPLTSLSNEGTIRGFDITPDGKHIVFDRVRQNSDVVLIALPKK